MFSSFRSTCRATMAPALFLVVAASAILGPGAGSLSAQSPQTQSGSSSSETPAEPAAGQAPAAQAPAHSTMTVQQRIKLRREQRREAAIHEVYSHLYEAYVGSGFLYFQPGPSLQRMNEWAWNVGATRYYTEKFGVTLDGRGLYGSAYVGINAYSDSAIYKPAISQYTGMIGPTYRVLLHPKFSVSARVMGGAAYGNFSGDLGTFKPSGFGLYSDSIGLALSASAPIEYNVTPEVGLRLAPEYFVTSFGSSIQNNVGATGGIVVRWGKQ